MYFFMNQYQTKIKELEDKVNFYHESAISAYDSRDRVKNELDEVKSVLCSILSSVDMDINKISFCNTSEIIDNIEKHHRKKILSELKFPVFLRKMWSGGEVQKWIDNMIKKEEEEK